MDLILFFAASFVALFVIQLALLMKTKSIWLRLPALIVPVVFFTLALYNHLFVKTSLLGFQGLTTLFWGFLGICALCGYLCAFAALYMIRFIKSRRAKNV